MAEKVITDDLIIEDNAVSVQGKKNKAKKLTVVITYLFALLCLLAGLLVPLYGYIGGVKDVSNFMLLKHIPRMVNNVVAIIPVEALKNGIIPSDIKWFGDVMIEGAYKFDMMSLLGIFYALLCLFAIVMLLPVCLGKKEKNTSAAAALTVEILGLLLTLTYTVSVFYYAGGATLIWHDYNIMLAMGGLFIAAVLQSIATKGGIGFSKTIGIILSLLAVFALFDIAMLIPKTGEWLDKISDLIKSGETRSFLTLSGGAALGLYGIACVVDYAGTIEIFIELSEGGTAGILNIVALILLILLVAMVLFNLFCDTIGLGTGKKFKKDRSPCRNGASNGFALFRYIYTIVLAGILAIYAIIVKFAVKVDIMAGIYLYALIVVVFLQIVNAAIRTAVANSRYKKGKLAPSAVVQETLVIEDPAFIPEPEPAYAQPAPLYEQPAAEPVYEQPATLYEEPAVYAQPASEEIAPVYNDYAPTYTEAEPVYEQTVIEPLSEPVEPQPAEPKVNTVYIYSGDTDEFLDTLSDKEKYEFVDVFLKKSKGSVNGVPEYRINEDNSDFFPAVFVHINRYRNIVSDALMSKMYKQLGKIQ